MKTMLITGATDGIGMETARQLAQQGHKIVLHGRTLAKTQRARNEILLSVPEAMLDCAYADFANLSEVARMVRDLFTRLPKLDVLVNNAGVYMTGRELTHDGFEMTLGVNHLAHFLLTSLLLPLLNKSPDPRVVTVSSMVHSSGRIDFDNMNSQRRFDGYHAYANSKLANVLFAIELARREPWLASNCLHPGVINTKLLHAAFSMTGSSVSEGARTSVYLAASDEVIGFTGKYFDRCVPLAPASQALDQRLTQRLWEWSENLVQPWLPGKAG